MMIPEFMRFYHYTAQQTLGEYAVRFFSLINSMNRIKADESMAQIMAVSTGMAGEQGRSTVEELQKQSRGFHGIVQEVKVVKKAQGK